MLLQRFEEPEDVVDGEAAPLEELDLAHLLALVARSAVEAGAPNGLEAGDALRPGVAQPGGDRLLAYTARLEVVRELERAEASRLRACRLLGEARIRKPAAQREVVQQAVDVVALLGPRCQLAPQLHARVLAPRKKTHGPGSQGRLGF